MFENTYASSGSELIAYALAGLLYKKLGTRATLCLGWVVALAGGLLILFLSGQHEALMPVFVLIAKFGIAVNFVLIYIVTV